MCFFFTVPLKNTNPSLGPVQGNKQSISVYDSKLGNHRTVVATPEECDKFINDRRAARKDGAAKCVLANTVLGLGAGAGIGAIAGKKETKTINQLVDKANELLKSGKSKMDATFGTEKWWEVDKLYDKASNSFKKISDSSKIKEFAKNGVFAGAFLGLMLGAIVFAVKASKETDAVTREFIVKHSQTQKTEKDQ